MTNELTEHPSYGSIRLEKATYDEKPLFCSDSFDLGPTYHLSLFRAYRTDKESAPFLAKEIVAQVAISHEQFNEMMMGEFAVPCTLRYLEGKGNIEPPPKSKASIQAEAVLAAFKKEIAEASEFVLDCRQELEDLLDRKNLTSEGDKADILAIVDAVLTNFRDSAPIYLRKVHSIAERIIERAETQARISFRLSQSEADADLKPATTPTEKPVAAVAPPPPPSPPAPVASNGVHAEKEEKAPEVVPSPTKAKLEANIQALLLAQREQIDEPSDEDDFPEAWDKYEPETDTHPVAVQTTSARTLEEPKKLSETVEPIKKAEVAAVTDAQYDF
jgi:hypothetical protein